MRTTNAELLAEIDTLEGLTGKDASDLEVVKAINKHVARIAELEEVISKIPVMDKRKFLSRAAWPMMDRVIEAKQLLEQANDQ